MGDKIMKRITAVAFFTLASIFGVGSAFAQMQPREVRATVPFDFTVGDKLLPAGTYTVAPAMDGQAVQIQSRKVHLVVLTQGSNDSRPSARCVLNFDRRGGRYFMRGILCGSAAMSVHLPASKIEKRVDVEEAKLQDSGSQVMIAAK
jgi:hypothetical protein